ncbi:MAG: hypothetical protein JJE46_16480 [Acidimicrobiia bacterium]|nr:hypothetical protein [Acidimicrobiia bacterium]
MRRLIVLVVATVLGVGFAPASGATRFRPDGGPPRVTVDVATGVLDGQVLHVRGTGLIPGEPVAFMNCLGTGACYRGWTGIRAVADSRGRVVADVPVKRYRSDYMGDMLSDCAYSLCTMRIVRTGGYEDGYMDRAETRVSFARVATTSPTSVLTPATLLPPVATVRIDVGGFTPGARVKYDCVRTTCTGSDQWIDAGPSGTASITLTVTRLTRDSRDCVETDDCSVTLYPNTTVGTTVPLRFDPSMPFRLPSVTVAPHQVRTVTGTVTVDVVNAGAGERLTVEQCAAVNGSERCGLGTSVVADGLGRVRAPVPVTRFITQQWGAPPVYFSPLVDCAASSCVISVRRDGWYYPIATAPLAFAPDPQLPTMRIGSAVVREGGSPGQVVRLPVTLDRPTRDSVSFGWTANGASTPALVTIPPGATRASLDVVVPGNDQDDPHRAIAIQLTTIVGAQPDLRVPAPHVRVIDDDPTPTLDVANGLVPEGAPGVFVPVHLSGPTGRHIEFTYRTIGGSARPGTDYVEQVGVVDYPYDDLQIWVPIVDDSTSEPIEQFDIEIVAVVGARMGNSRAHVWIGDNDGPAG